MVSRRTECRGLRLYQSNLGTTTLERRRRKCQGSNKSDDGPYKNYAATNDLGEWFPFTIVDPCVNETGTLAPRGGQEEDDYCAHPKAHGEWKNLIVE